ncbi:4-(cytidine 5'-diphospho)-2-C-methyl-D-erythritol kinase [Tessaracoccus antarcticus]|uniref:4-diphosphocytidyl-2-C-methyl-D-erythritol kinase n=1 Tax=Tessaracoccus antarcticus TaxID=2479848 RepID=A0A3M0GB42_9ACTN|nr:4-(cytidine 5'-diphospho)-2-C-methyl-D-erythritol kinase [Tessaracoccus antarcticus]RMB62150.1 4-(cytidine 5'-diphospho)-2-C-methyl-D-erythritol kinase [Tessaracoccus antarcticus]
MGYVQHVAQVVRVRVPAKVNLALCVGAADDTGYHELGTVFQALSLWDELTVEPAPPGVFKVAFRGEGAAFLPTDDTNLAIRAAKMLAEHCHVADAGCIMLVRKRIPVAGGMAGGSADAAAVLVACNHLWGSPAPASDLRDLAAQLGADVPFLLTGGTAIGTGRGDIIDPVESRGTYHWTLALSHTGLSTPAVFREFDRVAEPTAPRIPQELLDALAAGDVPAVGRNLVNHLADAAIRLQPTLGSTLQIGLDAGALGGVVSGSGPTCAFLSDSAESAALVAEALGVFSGVRAVRSALGPVTGAALWEDHAAR